MKKIFAIMMILCLCACAAMAESTTLNWADFESVVASSGLEGRFVNFDEVAVKMWLPNDLQEVELTDDDKAQGFIGYFQDAEQTATVSFVYVDVEGMDLDTLAQKLPEHGATEIESATINGLPALSYKLTESNCCCVDFATEAGYILEVTMAPIDQENAELVWGVLAASIQAE